MGQLVNVRSSEKVPLSREFYCSGAKVTSFIKTGTRSGGMAQWLIVLAALADDLGSIPSTHVV